MKARYSDSETGDKAVNRGDFLTPAHFSSRIVKRERNLENPDRRTMLGHGMRSSTGWTWQKTDLKIYLRNSPQIRAGTRPYPGAEDLLTRPWWPSIPGITSDLRDALWLDRPTRRQTKFQGSADEEIWYRCLVNAGRVPDGSRPLLKILRNPTSIVTTFLSRQVEAHRKKI